MSATYSRYSLPSPSTHIRLVILNPSLSRGKPLECRLIVCPVDETPAYTAMLYTCGEGTFEESVIVQPDQEILLITTRLAEGLRHIRDILGPQTLWIDQICINQADSKGEKGPQVQLIGDIFSNAEQVLAWLGPADGISDEMMDDWEQIERMRVDLGFGYSEDLNKMIGTT